MFLVSKNTNILIYNNTFEENEAEIQGGAIKWDESLPEINKKTNIYINNKALYGEDVASYPIRLQLIYSILNQNLSSTVFNYFEQVYDSLKNKSTLEIMNISSGNDFHCSFNFFLLDYYGNVVKLSKGLKF